MRLSKVAILAIRGTSPEFKVRLAEACGVSLRTMWKWISENNDDLTKAEPLKMIREETGLDDSQILEEEKEPVTKD